MFQKTLSVLDPLFLSLINFFVKQVVIRSLLDVQTVLNPFGPGPIITSSSQVLRTRERLSEEIFLVLLRFSVAFNDGPRPLQRDSGR